MLINRISTCYLVVLLMAMPVVQVFAQGASRDSVKNIDSGTITQDGSADINQESDTAFFSPGFNEKRNAMQQAVKQRNLIGDTLHKLQSGEDFWYANAKAIKKESQESKFSFLRWLTKRLSGATARFIIWCFLIGGMIFFFVFYLVNNETGIFVTTKRKVAENKNADVLPDNIFEIDFEKALAASLATPDYRLSVRLLFLQLLKTMSNRKVIAYSMDKTNFDYLFQLNGTDYFTPFSSLIKSYEYTWYGEFAVSEQQYALIEKNFSQFQQQINHLN